MCITHLARDYGSGSKGTQRTEALVGFRLSEEADDDAHYYICGLQMRERGKGGFY